MQQTARQISVFRDKAYIGGSWLSAISKKTFPVYNPYNNELLSEVPDMDADDTSTAIKAAHTAFEQWKKTTARERARALRRLYDKLVEHQDELAKLLTLEQGKPLKESAAEIMYGSSYFEFFSEETTRIEGEVLATPVKSKQYIVSREPIGVAAMITPWNFPFAMITRKAAAAIAAGCTCVVKPAEDTPHTALALAHLAEQSGLPAGVFNVITATKKHAPEIGRLLCTSPLVAGLSFTGSTPVGKLLYRDCAVGVKRLALELGGNAPFIVFNSANLDTAGEGVATAKFRNSGQTCVSANKFLIQDGIYDKFLNRMQEMVKTLQQGNGLDPGVNQGPLINDAQLEKVKWLVADAVGKGAKVVAGGSAMDGRFFQPSILTDITPDMECYYTEIFGPVILIRRFTSEEEGLAMANDTEFGLAGYFFSEDQQQINRVSENLQVGMMGINEGAISATEMPFGGIKQSGIGREGSRHGLDEYLFLQTRCIRV